MGNSCSRRFRDKESAASPSVIVPRFENGYKGAPTAFEEDQPMMLKPISSTISAMPVTIPVQQEPQHPQTSTARAAHVPPTSDGVHHDEVMIDEMTAPPRPLKHVQLADGMQATHVAQHPYTQNSEDELTIWIGDRFRVLNASDAGWWEVERSGDGTTGVVPAAYLRQLTVEDEE